MTVEMLPIDNYNALIVLVLSGDDPICTRYLVQREKSTILSGDEYMIHLPFCLAATDGAGGRIYNFAPKWITDANAFVEIAHALTAANGLWHVGAKKLNISSVPASVLPVYRRSITYLFESQDDLALFCGLIAVRGIAI